MLDQQFLECPVACAQAERMGAIERGPAAAQEIEHLGRRGSEQVALQVSQDAGVVAPVGWPSCHNMSL